MQLVSGGVEGWEVDEVVRSSPSHQQEPLPLAVGKTTRLLYHQVPAQGEKEEYIGEKSHWCRENKIQVCRQMRRFIVYNYTPAVEATHVLRTQPTFHQLWDLGLHLLSSYAAVSTDLTVLPKVTLTDQQSCVQGQSSPTKPTGHTCHYI